MPENQTEIRFAPPRSGFVSSSAFSAMLRFLCTVLFVVSFIGPIAGAASAELRQTAVDSKGPGLPFAIADFDGDLHPDLASVRVGSSDSTQSVYWIQLQLTAVGGQSIQLVGPVGGLQLLARDVNGDQAVDLVVMTASLGEPVAVFLNDGHGGFSRAGKNAFPAAFGRSGQNLAWPATSFSNAASIPPQTSIGISCQCASPRPSLPDASSLAWPHSGFPLDPTLISGPSRAPPPSVPQL